MPHASDVFIIGAGPTGLTLACELKRRGLNIRIIDKLPSPTTQSRALALQARSLEIFDKLGILEKLLDNGLPIDTVKLYENGKQVGKADFKSLYIDFPFVLIIPQSETEKILNARLEELGGHVERNVTLTDLSQIDAKFIVGCDGAHSFVRHALHLPFKGTKFSETFILADVVIHNSPFEHTSIQAFLSKRGIIGVIPLPQKDSFRLITTSKHPPSFEKLIDHPIDTVLWTAPFSIHRRIVSQMSKGNVFLCGDAAHIHSPAGGQGLNLGIQDAFNLAWKLDLVIRKAASPQLLDTYDQERRPVAEHTLWGTTFATFFITIPYPTLRVMFFKIFARLISLFRKKLVELLAEVKSNYRNPRPGDLAPMLETDPETRFKLLIFGKPDFQPVLSEELFAVEHIPLDNPLATLYNAKKPCLYLIRPDGYIAFRTKKLFSPNLRDVFQNVFFSTI